MQRIRYVVSHPHFPAYAVYCLIYISYGAIVTSLGPIIPYFAEEENHHETYYSYFFFCRSFGYITGSFVSKILQRYFDYHHILGYSVIVFSIFTTCLGFANSDYERGICIYLYAIACVPLTVYGNICIIEMFKNENLDAWLQVNHGIFGIGGLLGPIVVYFFQRKTFICVGLFALLFAYPLFKIKSPQLDHKKQENLLDQQKQEQKALSPYNALIICLMFYFVVGQEGTFGGWIPSYAVLSNYSGKQQATFYSSIFWFSITIFRFVLPFISGKTSSKLKFLALFAFFISFVDLIIIHFINPKFGMIFSALMYGLSNSVLFALCFTLSQEFNQKVKPSQGSNFTIATALGDGTLIGLTGYLIKKVSNESLYICVGVFNLMIWVLAIIVISSLRKEKQEADNSVQMKRLT